MGNRFQFRPNSTIAKAGENTTTVKWLRSRAVVIVQQAAKFLSAMDLAFHPVCLLTCIDQLVVQPLMIALAMIVNS